MADASAAADSAPRFLPWWYLTLGAATGSAGAVVAWSHFRTAGWTAVGSVGAVCALVGASMFGVGARDVGRHLGGARRWLVVPIGIVVLYAVVVPWCIAVYAAVPPRPSLGSANPADHGLDYRDVDFVGPGGVRLRGWFIPSRNGSVIVVLHGASSTRTAVLDQAVVLARRGFGVLMYDARGHGTSGGRAMELGWNAEGDVSAAIDLLTSGLDVDPDRIGVLGESLGGEVALGAAARDDRVAAVVAEGRPGGRWTIDGGCPPSSGSEGAFSSWSTECGSASSTSSCRRARRSPFGPPFGPRRRDRCS